METIKIGNRDVPIDPGIPQRRPPRSLFNLIDSGALTENAVFKEEPRFSTGSHLSGREGYIPLPETDSFLAENWLSPEVPKKMGKTA